MTTKPVTDASFEADVLSASGDVLVDFWATWCGPCKMIAPALDEISNEMAGKVNVVKMDIDQSPMTPGKYGVRGVPTLMLFRDGKIIGTMVGAKPKSELVKWINTTTSAAVA